MVKARYARSFGVFVGLALLLIAPVVRSASKDVPAGVQVSPIRSQPQIQPGESKTGTLTLINKTKQKQQVTMQSERFSTTNEEYDYAFEKSDDSAWVNFPLSSIELKPGQTTKVAYSLNVPTNATPGGHYFALLATTVNDASSEALDEYRRVASLVYLEVPGDLSKKVNLASIGSPWLVFDRNFQIDVRLTNEGNTHIKSRVTAEASPLFSQNQDDVVVESVTLPGTTRKIVKDFSLASWPGIYRIRASLAPPQGGEQTKDRYVAYIPPYVVLSLAFLGLLVYIEVVARRHSKRDKVAQKDEDLEI